MSVPVFSSVSALRAQVHEWRRCGETIALVPTMGALHRGHLALIKEGRSRATRTIASIFVNPTQFGPTEDFSAYPRTFESDLAKLADADADGCFAPTVAEIYPPGFSATVTLAGPATANLEDRFRPTHFAGVATIVAKLLNQVQPDSAIFGQKDYQQLLVIRAMARDLDLPVGIVGLPTVRETDGLALSSRNVYLLPQERATAPVLHRALQRCLDDIRHGQALDVALDTATQAITEAGLTIDYLEARNAETLMPLASDKEPIRLLVAAKLGRTRLIDNIGALS